MNAVMTMYKTSIGKKVAMAVSGTVLFGFVVVHMIGNLQVYLGPEVYNGYAEKLQANQALVWAVRLVLLGAVGVHIQAAFQLWSRNRGARPGGYRGPFAKRDATLASRMMIYAGLWLGLFIVYHLLHFTVGASAVHPDFVRGDVYSNLIIGFQNPLVSVFYIASMLALGLHLYHGSWSMLQSLGLSHPRYNDLRKKLAIGLAGLVVAGNLSFPIAVMTGLLSL